MKVLSIKDFEKLDLRIGKIEKAERVEGTRKLLKLEVNLGDKLKTLVAGIAECYSPEDLIGKEVVVLTNLEPKKIRGVLSEGMLLVALSNGKPVLLVPEEPVPPGSKIS